MRFGRKNFLIQIIGALFVGALLVIATRAFGESPKFVIEVCCKPLKLGASAAANEQIVVSKLPNSENPTQMATPMGVP